MKLNCGKKRSELHEEARQYYSRTPRATDNKTKRELFLKENHICYNRADDPADKLNTIQWQSLVARPCQTPLPLCQSLSSTEGGHLVGQVDDSRPLIGSSRL